ncbi:MAG: ABC transporter ATP-binding protein [Actinobacteria bacterium]|nr:MAG: ABC transporter ATP-binding protein [Actinomycetota bacterium]REK38272.1 MAG: ABC transporter ATP-binding protein [Actinomycetota bacterium]
MSTNPAVRAESLTKVFSGGAGVFDLDMEVEPGSIVGLIGPSGSGKTTTVRLLTGLLTPDSGTVRVLGERPIEFSRETRAKLGYMPQDSVLYPGLTIRQNLDFAGTVFGMRKGRGDRIERLLDFFELTEIADRMPHKVSGGERRRASLAATLIHNPMLIFLDEPTAGLDPVLRRKLWDMFEDLAKDDGRTLVVTTQYVGEAAYCDYVAVLAEGRILILDTPGGLRRHAYGGELVDVVFSARPSPVALDHLASISARSEPIWIDARSLRVVVDDAGAAVPRLADWAGDNGLVIEKVEAYTPPFDDIFVEVVEKYSRSKELEAV